MRGDSMNGPVKSGFARNKWKEVVVTLYGNFLLDVELFKS